MAKKQVAPSVVLVNATSQVLKVLLPTRQVSLSPYGQTTVSALEAAAPYVQNLISRAFLTKNPVK